MLKLPSARHALPMSLFLFDVEHNVEEDSETNKPKSVLDEYKIHVKNAVKYQTSCFAHYLCNDWGPLISYCLEIRGIQPNWTKSEREREWAQEILKHIRNCAYVQLWMARNTNLDEPVLKYSTSRVGDTLGPWTAGHQRRTEAVVKVDSASQRRRRRIKLWKPLTLLPRHPKVL